MTEDREDVYHYSNDDLGLTEEKSVYGVELVVYVKYRMVVVDGYHFRKDALSTRVRVKWL